MTLKIGKASQVKHLDRVQDIFLALQLEELNNENLDIIKAHRLQGLYCKSFNCQPAELALAYKANALWNTLHFEKIDLMNRLAFGSSGIGMLKGASLYDLGVYEDLGVRPMSDVDFFVTSIEPLRTALNECNLTEVKSSKWLGDDFKYDFVEGTGESKVFFEFHEKLYWSQKNKFIPLIPGLIWKNLSHFSLEEELFILTLHFIYLDGIKNLLPIFDIVLFYSKFKNKIDHKKVYKLFEDESLLNTYRILLHVFELLNVKHELTNIVGPVIDLTIDDLKSISKLKYLNYKWKVQDSKASALYYGFRRAFRF